MGERIRHEREREGGGLVTGKLDAPVCNVAKGLELMSKVSSWLL